MELLKTRNILLRVILIVASAECIIMLLLQAIPTIEDNFSFALLDVALLSVLTTPALYLWVVRPFVRARDKVLSQLNELASTDPLTQLANRRVMAEHLKKVISGSAKHGISAAVMLLDLDRFKLINDDHGHDVGDVVLVETAKRIRSIIRAEDVASRFGGDEFVLIINRLGSDKQRATEDALRIAEKVIQLVRSPIVFNDHVLSVEASIGVRLLGFDKLDSSTALSEADAAMYHAKQAGKGRAVLFER